MNDRIENLWGSFDLISAELVKAKRALREGRGGGPGQGDCHGQAEQTCRDHDVIR